MKKTKAFKLAAFLLITVLLSNSCKDKKQWIITSPDNHIVFTLRQDKDADTENTRLLYDINVINKDKKIQVIAPSPLGFTMNGQSFEHNLNYESHKQPKAIKDNYSLVAGKQKNISYTANEATYIFSNENKERLELNIHVFNEGVAFRYILPGDDNKKLTVESEATAFNIGGDKGKAWIAPYDKAAPWSPGYERYFTNGSPIGEDAPEKQGWAFPCLFNSQGHWIYISESNLQDNYVASHLQPEVNNNTYTIRFPEKDERYDEGGIYPTSTLPWTMPWRFIIISDHIGDIVESNMVYHLSEPSIIEDNSWIMPGIASWEWWSSTSGRTVKRLKQYIDLAEEMNWKYSLIDAGWETMPDGTIGDVIAYAKQKNVDLLLWYNSGGRRENAFSRKKYIMENPDLRAKEMKKLQEWGIKGLKIDFFNSDKQHVIKLYHDILKDAAKHHLVVNFHGCTLPRGWERTYPNLLTSEAIRGAESYRFDEDFPENAPWHNTIAVFTRNVVGPMDYTPCTFSDQKYPHKTTYGHELALSVVFESGIIHMADRASAYQNLPDVPKDFLKNVPASWDETRFIDGYPGELAILAQKKGDTWYLAGINGLDVPMDKELSLSFLDEDKQYKLTFIEDGDTPREFRISGGKTGHGQSIIINMAPLGGFVAVFE